MGVPSPEIPFDKDHMHYRGDVVDLTGVTENSSYRREDGDLASTWIVKLNINPGQLFSGGERLWEYLFPSLRAAM